MFYVYGIVDAPHFDSIMRGHLGAEIVAIACGGVAAAASALGRRVVPEPRAVWRHEHVLQALMRRHAVLPLRFGTMTDDRETLRRAVAGLLPVLTRDFARLRGKVELALRIKAAELGKDGSGPEADDDRSRHPPGTEYLRAKAALQRRRTTRQESVRAVENALRPYLDRYAAEATWDADDNGELKLTASYLISRDDVGLFFDVVEQIRRAHPELSLSCTGPWAPYSFVLSNTADALQ